MSLVRDLRYSLRSLVREGRVLLPAVVSLAFGIGGVLLGYRLLDALLLHPFPAVRNLSRLVRITFKDAENLSSQPFELTSYPTYRVLSNRPPRGVQDVAGIAERYFDDPLSAGASIHVAMVTPGYFDVLGTTPQIGRGLVFDSTTGSQFAAVISESYWRRAFLSQRSAIGAKLRLGRQSFTVVGVMPSGFRGDHTVPVDAWILLDDASSELPSRWRQEATGYWLRLIARLADGATLDVAQQQAHVLEVPELPQKRLRLELMKISAARSADGGMIPEAALRLWICALAALVLLMAASNVTTLLIARTLERRTESAVMFALGASRWQIARSIIARAAVIAIGGTLLAIPVVTTVSAWLSSAYPELLMTSSIGESLGLVLTAIVMTVLVAGLISSGPLLAQPIDLGGALRGQGGSAVVRASFLRSFLLGGQIAIAVVLLALGQALVRSFINVHSLYLGVDVNALVVIQFDRRSAQLAGQAANELLLGVGSDLRRRGIASATSVSTAFPFISGEGVGTFAEGIPYPLEMPGGGPYIAAITPEYFTTTGLTVLSGRAFAETDGPGAERVAIISKNLADRAWPGQNPIGRCLTLGSIQECTRIVGLTKEGRLMRLREETRSFVYVPLSQYSFQATSRFLVVRTVADPDDAMSGIRQVLANSPLLMTDTRLAPVRDVIAPQWRQWSIGALTFGVVAILGVALAAGGVYATVSMLVAARATEFAVRSAIGASPTSLSILAASSTVITALVGIGVGVVALLAGNQIAAPLLFETTLVSPATILFPMLVLLAVCLPVVLRPLLRATNPDLLSLLRSQ